MRGRPPRVVYVAGYGHSGSTILNIVLGQHPDVFGAGELFRLAGTVWPGREYCSCGLPATGCPVWREVVRRWRELAGGADPVPAYAAAQRACETPWAGGGGAGRRGAYAELSRALFGAIADVTGRPVIVDSSKLPARALALARVEGLDLRLLHLVRDGRGVAWSLRRSLPRDARAGLQAAKRPRSVVRTGLLWTAANLAADLARRRLGPARSLLLRYESFVEEPRAALAAIGPLAGLDLAPTADRLLAGRAPLDPGHVVAGNRLRMDKALRLRRDEEGWRRNLPRVQRLILDRLCGPTLRRYGYAEGGP